MEWTAPQMGTDERRRKHLIVHSAAQRGEEVAAARPSTARFGTTREQRWISNLTRPFPGGDPMRVREIMTSNVVTAGMQSTLEEIAVMMREADTGAIPIVD